MTSLAPPGYVRAVRAWRTFTEGTRRYDGRGMTGETLTISSERQGDTFRVAPVGELDIATAGLLERELASVAASDAAAIVLDLSGLTFIDSTGLRIVLDFTDLCGDQGGRLGVIAGTPAVDRLLDIVGLRERLPLITP